MSTSLIPLLAYALLSALVAALRHPGDAPGAGPALLRFLGALSCLRFRDAPGAALSVPLLPQRGPDPTEPPEAALLAMAVAARRAYVAHGGVVPPVVDPGVLRRAWIAACRSAMVEWSQLLLQRSWGAEPPEPPHDPAIPPQPPRAGTIITSVALLVALGLGWACTGPQTHTSALRSGAERAVKLCQQEAARCPAARACTRAAVRAGDAWVIVARLREADARHRAGSGGPVDLQGLADQERAALALEQEARAACAAVDAPPQDVGSAPVPPPDMEPRDLAAPRRDGGDL